jgi:hypothetical protein
MFFGQFITLLRTGEFNEMIFCVILITMGLCSIAWNIGHKKNNKEDK